MRVEDCSGKILGIELPWETLNIRLEQKASVVHVTVAHEEGIRSKCPCCDRALAIYDHVEERPWSRRDTCQYETWLHARIPRVNCPDHEEREVRISWAELGSRFTLLFERHAPEGLTACEVVSAECDILRIS